MSNKLTIHSDKEPIYDIVFETSFKEIETEIKRLQIENRKICIVTETTVEKLYLETVTSLLSPLCKEVVSFVFPAGEKYKNLSTVNDLYVSLIENHFDRNDLLVALGGGVVGDLTGFAAATYLRGIDFVQIPTSLLAQVDSSIGGKTGVDFLAYKNMVGAFHQPKLVYINIDTLNTLSPKEFNSGLGEIIKHGLIKDKAYYNWIIDNKNLIVKRDEAALLSMIKRSCEIKGMVVENDPKEQGERALLNFGHTLGHSIEKLCDFSLLHGECVVLGMILSGFVSAKRGSITQEEYQNMLDILDFFEFPGIPSGLKPEQIVATTKLDKKMDSGTIKFILLEEIGKAYIDRTVTDEEMNEAITAYLDGSSLS